MTTTPLRILVVDDDEIVASLHRDFVDRLDGFVICGIAGTGPEAVAAIRELAPDIVLLDMHLPGFSGLELLRRIRTDRRHQPEVIAVTAARDLETVRDARLAGVRHYLAKPFSSADLRSRLLEVARGVAQRSTSIPLEQGQIDALMAPLSNGGGLPKGMSSSTLTNVLTALQDCTEVTAAELGERLGLSRVSCRRYLEYLVDSGAVTRNLDYSTSGRPSSRYAVRSDA
jgi:response regulator of citrate/malate metabolism